MLDEKEICKYVRCYDEYDGRLDICLSHAGGSRMKGVTNWPHEEGWTTPWATLYHPLERDMTN